MKNLFLLTGLLLWLTSDLYSQSYTGRVIDQDLSESLPYANVVFFNASDTSYVSGTVTDQDGYFKLDTPEGNYLLQISMIGYESLLTPVTKKEMGNFHLSSRSELLSEVVITATARLFRMEAGGITADIQNTPLKEMGNLSEVLGQMPFVLKTGDNYTVLGKGSPIFYINNRLVRDQNEIQRISSKEIKRITVVTNPGAEYDASVSAVIKIETIAPVGEGWSGSISTYDRYNSKWYSYNNLILNYRKGGFDIFGGLTFADMALPKNRTITNNILTDSEEITIIANNKDRDKLRFATPKIGFNYIITENHIIGAQYEYNHTFDVPMTADIRTQVINGQEEEFVTSETLFKSPGSSHYVNAYYNGEFSRWLSARLEMDFKPTEQEDFNDQTSTREDGYKEYIKSYGKSTFDLYAAKLTLATPLWEGNLTYGGEISYTLNKQFVDLTEETEIPGIVASSNRVKQNLAAGFISYSKSIGDFSADLGLRYEDVRSEYFQNGILVDEQSKRYKKLFPNARITYQIKGGIQMELAYRNSVSRPSYSSLRSTILYTSPHSYYSGNPLLKPTYNNSLTYTAMWKSFTFMAIYNIFNDPIVELPQLYLGNSILIKPINIDKSKQLSLTLNYRGKFGCWSPNWDVSMQKDYLEFGDPELKYNDPVLRFNLRNNFKLKSWNTGVNIRISSKGHDNAEYQENVSWSTSLYVNRSFFNNKLNLNITGTDIFNTSNDDVSMITNRLRSLWEGNYYRRNISVSATYRFNSSPARYKGQKATDELDRM